MARGAVEGVSAACTRAKGPLCAPFFHTSSSHAASNSGAIASAPTPPGPLPMAPTPAISAGGGSLTSGGAAVLCIGSPDAAAADADGGMGSAGWTSRITSAPSAASCPSAASPAAAATAAAASAAATAASSSYGLGRGLSSGVVPETAPPPLPLAAAAPRPAVALEAAPGGRAGPLSSKDSTTRSMPICVHSRLGCNFRDWVRFNLSRPTRGGPARAKYGLLTFQLESLKLFAQQYASYSPARQTATPCPATQASRKPLPAYLHALLPQIPPHAAGHHGVQRRVAVHPRALQQRAQRHRARAQQHVRAEPAGTRRRKAVRRRDGVCV